MAILTTLAAVYGGTAVALGAFGAHGLKKRIADPARLQNWNTAAQVNINPHALLPHNLFLVCFAPSSSSVLS
jgi:uncharacterized membrane protein YgdD (TMEM256/DUF423 family)